MYNHEPADYRCPFCRNLSEGADDYPLELLYLYDDVFVKVAPKWWPANPGGALVIPIDHYENVFDLPVELGSSLQAAVRDTALAMKWALGCEGVSTRQHNEPAGGQDVWHYHVHVFPRYTDDKLYGSHGAPADAAEIRRIATLLRATWPAGV